MDVAVCTVFLFGYAILIMVGFFVCIYGSVRSILMLIAFGNEDRSVIESEAERREEVAHTVANIVHKMDTDFRSMLNDLNTVNDAMSSADAAMNDISDSTENRGGKLLVNPIWKRYSYKNPRRWAKGTNSTKTPVKTTKIE